MQVFLRDIENFQDKFLIIPGNDDFPEGQVWRKDYTIEFICRGELQQRHYKSRRYTTWVNDSGYVEFSLNNHHHLIHRAIAEIAFGEIFYNCEEVNHKDGNKRNNRISNLECVTHDENIEHAMKSHLIPAFPVLDLVTGEVHASASAIDRKLNKYDGYTVSKLIHNPNRIVGDHPMILCLPVDRFQLFKASLHKYKEILVEYPNGTRELVQF